MKGSFHVSALKALDLLRIVRRWPSVQVDEPAFRFYTAA